MYGRYSVLFSCLITEYFEQIQSTGNNIFLLLYKYLVDGHMQIDEPPFYVGTCSFSCEIVCSKCHNVHVYILYNVWPSHQVP